MYCNYVVLSRFLNHCTFINSYQFLLKIFFNPDYVLELRDEQ